MPKGPQGQKRPADVIGAAVRVARIATGEEPKDPVEIKNPHAAERIEVGCDQRDQARRRAVGARQERPTRPRLISRRWRKLSRLRRSPRLCGWLRVPKSRRPG